MKLNLLTNNNLRARVAISAKAFLLAAGTMCFTQAANAQITDRIEANIPHSFVVGNKTYPAGAYEFQMSENSELSLMTMRSEDGKQVAEFNVREGQENAVPQHSKLVFNKYGDIEFLKSVYEAGSQIGSVVADEPKQERELESQGQHGIQHAE